MTGSGTTAAGAALVDSARLRLAGEPSAWPVADPEALQELVPDTVLDALGHGPLAVRAASIRGEAARQQGLPRTDGVFTARFGRGDDELLFLAVSSGGQSARAACRTLAAAVGRSHARLAQDLRATRRGSLKSGLHRLTDRAYGRLHPAEDGASARSLRCLLLTGDPRCRTRVFFGLGRGGLFRLRGNRWLALDPAAARLSAGSSAGSDRAVGTGAAAERVFRFHAGAARPGDVLLLCSEGLAEPLRGDLELARRLAVSWGPHRQPPSMASFLADAATPAEGYPDDRTAIAVWDR